MHKTLLLISSASIVMTMATASCAGPRNESPSKGETLKARIESCTDPDSIKSYLQQAEEYAIELKNAGKSDEYETYVSELAAAARSKDIDSSTRLDSLAASSDSIAAKAIKTATDTVAAKVEGSGADIERAATDALRKAKETAQAIKSKAEVAAD